jgi:hypothetical protein
MHADSSESDWAFAVSFGEQILAADVQNLTAPIHYAALTALQHRTTVDWVFSLLAVVLQAS